MINSYFCYEGKKVTLKRILNLFWPINIVKLKKIKSGGGGKRKDLKIDLHTSQG